MYTKPSQIEKIIWAITLGAFLGLIGTQLFALYNDPSRYLLANNDKWDPMKFFIVKTLLVGLGIAITSFIALKIKKLSVINDKDYLEYLESKLGCGEALLLPRKR